VTARWLAEQGAGKVVLASRSGGNAPGIRETVQFIESLGTQIEVLSVDVTDPVQVRAMIECNGAFPLRGVIHGAMVLDDAMMADLSHDRFQRVFLPKVAGALNLAEALRKVPDLDFLNALQGADELRRAEALRDHAAKLRATIKALADRDYPRQFTEALDYVVLFLPAESLFSAALEGDRDLIVWAAERRILLATPASLIALLRSVAVSWQQHDQSVNARAIAEAARELFERVAKFTEHFESIRDGLQKAGDAYNRALASYDSRVRPQGDKLAKLGGTPDNRQLAEVEPLDATLRLPPATAG
jgi:hypothetical protein